MSLSVQKISSYQVASNNNNLRSITFRSGMPSVEKSIKKPLLDVNSIIGLIGWAILLISSIGGIAYGIVENLKEKQSSEVISTPSNNTENNTFDSKNI